MGVRDGDGARQREIVFVVRVVVTTLLFIGVVCVREIIFSVVITAVTASVRGCRCCVVEVRLRQVALALAPSNAGPHRGVHVTHRARRPHLRCSKRGRGDGHRIIVIIIVIVVVSIAEGVSQMLYDANQLGRGQRLAYTQRTLTDLL